MCLFSSGFNLIIYPRRLNIGYSEVQLDFLGHLFSYSLYTLILPEDEKVGWTDLLIHSINFCWHTALAAMKEKKMSKIQFQLSKRRLRTVSVRQNEEMFLYIYKDLCYWNFMSLFSMTCT